MLTQHGERVLCPDGCYLHVADEAARAEVEALRALLAEARDVVTDFAPGHTVLLDAMDAALSGEEET